MYIVYHCRPAMPCSICAAPSRIPTSPTWRARWTLSGIWTSSTRSSGCCMFCFYLCSLFWTENLLIIVAWRTAPSDLFHRLPLSQRINSWLTVQLSDCAINQSIDHSESLPKSDQRFWAKYLWHTLLRIGINWHSTSFVYILTKSKFPSITAQLYLADKKSASAVLSWKFFEFLYSLG